MKKSSCNKRFIFTGESLFILRLSRIKFVVLKKFNEQELHLAICNTLRNEFFKKPNYPQEDTNDEKFIRMHKEREKLEKREAKRYQEVIQNLYYKAII